MSQLEKLIELMLRLPPEARIEDVRKLYIYYGWEERLGGKHSTIFVSPEGFTRPIPTVSGRTDKFHRGKPRSIHEPSSANKLS